jgi:hypothetical protein
LANFTWALSYRWSFLLFLSCECIQLNLFRLRDLEIYLVLVCWIKIRAHRRIRSWPRDRPSQFFNAHGPTDRVVQRQSALRSRPEDSGEEWRTRCRPASSALRRPTRSPLPGGNMIVCVAVVGHQVRKSPLTRPSRQVLQIWSDAISPLGPLISGWEFDLFSVSLGAAEQPAVPAELHGGGRRPQAPPYRALLPRRHRWAR